MIYFLQAGEHVKIGRTTDAQSLSRRIVTLQTGQAHRLVLLRTIDAPGWAEGWLHGFFAGVRTAGEWFNYQEEMLTVPIPTEKPRVNPRITNTTRNLTMRYPVDLVEHAAKLAREGSLKPVFVAALRQAWNLPEPAKRSDKAA